VQDTGRSSSAFSLSTIHGNGTFKAPAAYMLQGKGTILHVHGYGRLQEQWPNRSGRASHQQNQIASLGNGDGAFKTLVLSAVDLPLVAFAKVSLQNAQPPCGVTLSKSSNSRGAGLRVDRQTKADTERFHNRRTPCKHLQGDMPPYAHFGQCGTSARSPCFWSSYWA
jgi:hypothetical protein